jgi:small subunit ribosomal protein S20
MKNAIKRIRSATDKNTAAQQLRKAVKLLDQLAAKGVIHPNKAANNKSQLTRLVNKLP